MPEPAKVQTTLPFIDSELLDDFLSIMRSVSAYQKRCRRRESRISFLSLFLFPTPLSQYWSLAALTVMRVHDFLAGNTAVILPKIDQRLSATSF
ncbi:hypothetical protein KCP71_25840 [Salmonella enterica subsp. enterica]|nr:hypothetical protein KCP71_25840 [Salmonella enterica subsp. enterica]